MRVLVVDDDAELLELVTRALERDGHVVTSATGLAEARTLMAGRAAEHPRRHVRSNYWPAAEATSLRATGPRSWTS